MQKQIIRSQLEASQQTVKFYEMLFRTSPDGIVLIGAMQHIILANDTFCSYFGKRAQDVLETSIHTWIEQLEGDAQPSWAELERRVRTGVVCRGTEYRLATKEGMRSFVVNASLLDRVAKEEKGTIISLWRDVSEVKRAEKALKESEGKYRSLMNDVIDQTEVGLFILDSDFKIVWINKTLGRYFGLKREEVIGKDKRRLILEQIQHTFEDGGSFAKKVCATYDDNTYVENFECHVISDGDREERWLEHWSQPLRSGFFAGGRVELYYDITARKRAEGQIKSSLKEKEVLLSEVHHRVKNNMQVITSLLKLQSAKIEDKQYADMFKESQGRIKSMALIHETLYQSGDFSNIDFNDYVKTLAKHLFRSHGVNPGKIQLKREIEDVGLSLERAIPCGLIINELVSNSLKYAFPEDVKGQIKITLRLINQDEIELTVSDDGIGMPDKVDIRKTESLGLRLVKILAENQLEGQIELNRTNGTQFSIKFQKQI